MQIELSDIIKIYNRIETLENRVSELEQRITEFEEKRNISMDRFPFPTEKVGEKYKRLAEYLYEKWDRTIKLNYAEIEQILGFSLPPTAYNLPQSYWANTETHSYAKGSWLAVGYKAKVNVDAKTVTFERNLY